MAVEMLQCMSRIVCLNIMLHMMADSTKVLCPLFDQIEILILIAFCNLRTKCKILIRYQNEEK